jgi:hypothetical protein
MDPVVREQYESGNTIVCIGTHDCQKLENYKLLPLEIEIDYTAQSCKAASTQVWSSMTLDTCEAVTTLYESRVRARGPSEWYTISLDDYRTDPVTLESHFGEDFYLVDGCDALEFINDKVLELDLEQRHGSTTTMIYAAVYRKTPWTPLEIEALQLVE